MNRLSSGRSRSQKGGWEMLIKDWYTKRKALITADRKMGIRYYKNFSIESLKAKESDARAILYKYMRMLGILSITSISWFGVWRWSWVNPFSNESHVVACAIFWSCTAVWGNALGNVLREIVRLYRGICWICVALKEEQEQEPS